jgi:phospholipid/cholesterol/gamma-HCH transport system substrate-binding protein
VKKRYPYIVAFSFLAALGLFIWGINFLKGKDVFKRERVFYAEYHEVSGLTKTNPVLIRGMRVGQVSSLEFHPNMKGSIMVTFSLDTDFPIPKNSVARIISSDLLGSKAVEIQIGNAAELIVSGDTLLSSLETSLMDEVNAQVAPLKMKAESLLSSIDSLVVVVQAVLNDDARDNITKSLNSISSTFANIERTSNTLDSAVDEERLRIGEILMNAKTVTASLEESADDFNRLIENLALFSDSLVVADVPGTLRKADESIMQIGILIEKINRGEGTFGMLMHNDTLYFELERSAEELNKLLEDIRANPKRYVKFSVF